MYLVLYVSLMKQILKRLLLKFYDLKLFSDLVSNELPTESLQMLEKLSKELDKDQSLFSLVSGVSLMKQESYQEAIETFGKGKQAFFSFFRVQTDPENLEKQPIL